MIKLPADAGVVYAADSELGDQTVNLRELISAISSITELERSEEAKVPTAQPL
jgi:hypothetical protein